MPPLGSKSKNCLSVNPESWAAWPRRPKADEGSGEGEPGSGTGFYHPVPSDPEWDGIGRPENEIHWGMVYKVPGDHAAWPEDGVGELGDNVFRLEMVKMVLDIV